MDYQNIRLYLNYHSYDGNIINIYDKNIKKIIKYFKNINENVYLYIPNTLDYCFKYKKTYYIEIINDYTIVKIPLIIGSIYDDINTEIDIKGCFVVDGKIKVVVNQEMRKYNNYMIISKKDVNIKDKYYYFCNNIKYKIIIEKNYIYLTNNDESEKINLINILKNNDLIKDSKLIKLYYINEYDYILINNNILNYLESNGEYNKNIILDENGKRDLILAFINILKGNMFDINDDIYYTEVHTSGSIIYSIFENEIVNKKNNNKKNITNFNDQILTLFKQGILNLKDKQYLGITQELSKRNYIDIISHIRKINKLNINSINAPEGLRSLKSSNFGYICCNETPESIDVGLTKYLSIFSLITNDINYISVKKINKFIIEYKNKTNNFKVFLDNKFITVTDFDFLINFKTFRQGNYDLRYVGIYKFEYNYYINTYGGRYIRPLIKKDKINLIKKYNNLKDYYYKNIIEYIDVYEFKNCKLDETHIELDKLSILGLSSSITPFLNTNQSTRISFQSGMVKQSITLSNKIINISDIKILIYAQIPTCKTIINDLIDFNSYGINILISVLPYYGYNQEDSLVFKKSSVEKGMFTSLRYDIQEIFLDADIFDIKLLVNKGNVIKCDDNIAIKYNKINKKNEYIKAKYNTTFNTNIINKIDIVKISNNYILKIRYKRYDILRTGDKLSSRYSQKGVIGKIEHDVNLPFNDYGIIPDIFINPHSFPSRMTIGHIIETVKSVEGIKNNKFINSTGFSFKGINDYIKKENNLNGIYINSINRNSIGYCYYQLLKHQVIEKMYSMTEGPRSSITKQPVNGKNNQGGLRLGELDKDCLLAHGVINIIYEKYINHSDKYKLYFCKYCYNIYDNKNSNCIVCGQNKTDYIVTTHSFKLLCDLLKGININTLLIKK